VAVIKEQDLPGELKLLSGLFFRVTFEESHVLRGAVSAYGRYHHDDQPALYLSPHAAWAQKAVEPHVRPDDPPRSICQLLVGQARVADVRDRELCIKLGIESSESDVPWQPQRANGLRCSTWNVSDASRRAGADGLIYTARTDAARWHLVLFRWNELGGPRVTIVR